MTTLIMAFVVVLCLPWVIYLSVKLGTFAFYRGRELYQETVKHERRSDGDD